MIDTNVLRGTLRHRWEQGVVWILHDGQATGLLDRPQARRSVVQTPRQNNAYRRRPIRLCGGAK